MKYQNFNNIRWNFNKMRQKQNGNQNENESTNRNCRLFILLKELCNLELCRAAKHNVVIDLMTVLYVYILCLVRVILRCRFFKKVFIYLKHQNSSVINCLF